MAEIVAQQRKEIPEAYQWNAASVYPSRAAWRADLQSVTESLPAMAQYHGRVAAGAAAAAAALAARDDLLRRAAKVWSYASMSRAVDTTDEEATQMEGQGNSLIAQTRAAVSFIEPELLAVDPETLRAWQASEPALAIYGHYFDDLLRRRAHVRSVEVEELLGLLADPFEGARTTAEILAAADLHYPPARTTDGAQVPVSEGTLDQLMFNRDREVRRTAWEGYRDTYLAHKHALTSNITTSIKQNAFNMRARRHESTLAAALFEQNIPQSVYDNLIATFRANLPTWHRYWAIRRQALGVADLQPYDVWAPLHRTKPVIPYRQAVDMIAGGLGPMGSEYVSVLRGACLEQRWVDVYPSVGKVSGAFSAGVPGTYPFILLNYDDSTDGLSALAHELGHSMHSYLTWQNQPTVYCDYGSFVAEVASNFHQAMVRAYLLETTSDPDMQISVIEEGMSNLHRYLFIMPTLARFELEVHRRIEAGQGLSADGLIELMADLFAEGYGGEMPFDRQRTGITWATFPHLYMDYYVFQYATGISAAHALSARIRAGVPGAVENYLAFLKAGDSLYPVDALKLAGVDLTSPQPVQEAFQILAGMVDRLERLVAR